MEKNLSDISDEEIDCFYKRVSEDVKKARLKTNISQLDLSLKLGMKSISFYSNCKNLKYDKHFNLEHVYKIAKILNIDICEILKE